MKYFFASGYNKSGTTFLQMLLDTHPNVACTPEHHLKTLLKGLHALNKNYEAVIQMFDDRTARQGLRYRPSQTMSAAFKSIIIEIFKENRKPNLKASGISDNWIFEFLPLLHRLLPETEYLFIVRDPRGVAVSLYHHLARTEPHRVHGITIDEFANKFGTMWCSHIDIIKKFQRELPEKVQIIKYEELTGRQRIHTLSKVFKILNVDHNEQTVAKIYERSDEIKSISKQRNNGFFRKGEPASWEEELSQKSKEAIVYKCEKQMKMIGYA